jgi:hypothetical protein
MLARRFNGGFVANVGIGPRQRSHWAQAGSRRYVRCIPLHPAHEGGRA